MNQSREYARCVEFLKKEEALLQYVSVAQQEQWCRDIMPCMERYYTSLNKSICLHLYPIRETKVVPKDVVDTPE